MNLTARSFIGFFLSPIVPSVAYAWISWGASAFIPLVYITLFIAYTLTVTLLAPIYIFLLKKNMFNIYTAMLASFLALFVLFSTAFLFTGSRYNELVLGSKILVENGILTLDGYKRLFHGAFIIGMHGALGGFIFTCLVRARNAFNIKCVLRKL